MVHVIAHGEQGRRAWELYRGLREIFDDLDFDYLLDHARHIHKLSETDKEKLHNEHHKTQRHLLPDLGNKGLKMLLVKRFCKTQLKKKRI